MLVLIYLKSTNCKRLEGEERYSVKRVSLDLDGNRAVTGGVWICNRTISTLDVQLSVLQDFIF